jgi:hypothetical protein
MARDSLGRFQNLAKAAGMWPTWRNMQYEDGIDVEAMKALARYSLPMDRIAKVMVGIGSKHEAFLIEKWPGKSWNRSNMLTRSKFSALELAD